MDGNRFDELARRFGSGLSRRQMLRVLLGGAGALAGTAVLKQSAVALPIGSDCTIDDNCDGDLVCNNGKCHCFQSENTIVCPAGTHHATKNKKDVGTCCDGNGGCCTNICTNNICAATGPTCSEEAVECGAGCCVGLICVSGFCEVPECSVAGDCTDTNDCYRAACTEGECVYSPADDFCTEDCEVCNTDGFCVSECGNGICCNDECVSGDCCIDEDCALSNCARVACTDHVCGAVSLCPPQPPNEVLCCAHEGQPELDYCYIIEEGECCFDEECAQVIISEGTCLVPICSGGICGFIRDHELCDKDTCCCENGSCSHDCCEDCREFGEECGLIVNGTNVATGSDQLDCCHGLVCCEMGNDHVCAECCGDFDCPKGTICCAGVCREIECCIDDILTGGDPNARCPEGCTCFEGLCVDHNQNHCRFCADDKDCPDGKCCCKDGTCSHECCEKPVCTHDKDCAAGTCCCPDGTCSHDCCPTRGTTTTAPPIGTLPNTGAGPDTSDASWIAGAALAAGAATLLGSKVIKDGATPAEDPES